MLDDHLFSAVSHLFNLKILFISEGPFLRIDYANEANLNAGLSMKNKYKLKSTYEVNAVSNVNTDKKTGSMAHNAP
jgi:hypothetical protein